MSLLNKKQKEVFDKEYQKLIALSEKLKIEADGDDCISDESYEVHRDSYRFFASVFVVLMSAAFFLTLLSSIIIFSKEPSKAFATSRDGYVFPLVPIKK